MVERRESQMRVGLTYEHKLNFIGGFDLVLKYRGENVGSCSLYPTKSGLADLLLDHFEVDTGSRGKKFGSDLIEYVNNFLISIKKSAYLIDAAPIPVRGIYARHGWKKIPGVAHGIYKFDGRK